MTQNPQQMASLFARMTQESGQAEVMFTDNQVQAVIEVLIPRMVTAMPGMPKGMKCDIDRDDDGKGWTLRIRRP
ncbi:hypothetical protein [Mycolicibacterium phlei]|uniref:hypothetical protein n=1 Tax=Mycolicibacterium phlei TaxID=1771 RepID=UPI000308B5F3|nr:hypothetical protein [Mycolicibacterium phlei]MBF4194629.1 hypothetical protein [Mycolicibacterium phlei]